MQSSLYQQSSLASAIAGTGTALPVRDVDQLSVARGACADEAWSVRVVLDADPAMAVQAVRVIIDDRAARRTVLHTVWTDWRAVPLLAALLGAPSPSTTLAAMAGDLAAALVASLRYQAETCLEQLGTPVGSLPPPVPGSQERAALRNVRDVAFRARGAAAAGRVA